MARPPRNAYPDGFFHVGTRGNDRRDIYLDGVDRYWFLEMLGRATVKYGWIVYAYCLMTTHYHVVLQVPEDGLSSGMCELNGGFARWSNLRHGRENHLFGKRFRSDEITTDSHLREACRYDVLNPVRAGMVAGPADWHWSSYRACAGLEYPLPWLAADRLLSLFSTRPRRATAEYRRFVREGLVASGHVPVPGTVTRV